MSFSGVPADLDMLMRSGEATKHLRVSRKTLIGYAKRGRISTVELPGGSKRVHRLYDVSSFCVKGGNDAPKNDMVVEAIYTRAPEGKERRVEVDTLRQQCGCCHGGVVVFADAPGDYDGIDSFLTGSSNGVYGSCTWHVATISVAKTFLVSSSNT